MTSSGPERSRVQTSGGSRRTTASAQEARKVVSRRQQAVSASCDDLCLPGSTPALGLGRKHPRESRRVRTAGCRQRHPSRASRTAEEQPPVRFSIPRCDEGQSMSAARFETATQHLSRLQGDHVCEQWITQPTANLGVPPTADRRCPTVSSTQPDRLIHQLAAHLKLRVESSHRVVWTRHARTARRPLPV